MVFWFETMVTMITFCKNDAGWRGGTVLNHFDQKRGSSLYQVCDFFIKQFLRDEMVSKFFWALKLKTLQPFSRFIPHSYALRQNDFDMRLEVLTKVLVWNFPHVRVKSIVWSAARYEPWDRSWMDDHINFSHTDAAHYCKEIFSVISFVWAQSDKRFISFCIRNSQRI